MDKWTQVKLYSRPEAHDHEIRPQETREIAYRVMQKRVDISNRLGVRDSGV